MAGSFTDYPGNHDRNIAGLSAYQQQQAYGTGCEEVSLYDNAPKVLGEGANSATTTAQGTRAYHASALYMDAQIGVILEALDQSPARLDTIVIFLGDHGFHLGDHALYGKHTNYDGSTKVPLLIRPALRDSAKYQIGSKSYAPVELLDLMPTLYEMAELTVVRSKYKAWEGVSLVPILHDPHNASVKKGAVSQYFRGTGAAKQFGYSIRTVRFRLTNWFGRFQEFFDYLDDDFETRIVEDYATKQTLLSTLEQVQNKKFGEPFDFAERDKMASKPMMQYP
ncbi:hypothetical protein BASA81_006767 [Batrachochytrium salamandrivorans]|nr:hypothetical protein BASA81_006767 [Batrachochytrium salamandrivorans]